VATRSVANRSKRSSPVGGGSESLAQEVADLLTLETSELREKWSALCGVDRGNLAVDVILSRTIRLGGASEGLAVARERGMCVSTRRRSGKG
jgi:hypothetical protein